MKTHGDNPRNPVIVSDEMRFYHQRFGILAEIANGRWTEAELLAVAEEVYRLRISLLTIDLHHDDPEMVRAIARDAMEGKR